VSRFAATGFGLLIGISIGTACVSSSPRGDATPSTAAPAGVDEPEAPEPTALVELAPVEPEPEPEPLEPLPFSDAQLERILAVQPIVAAAAAEHGVEPALINGVIWVESKFDPRARGPAGAQGLMQLMPKTAGAMAAKLGRKRNSYDPDFNIHAGTLLLARLLARFDGDPSLALAAYNRGTGVVAGWVAAGEPLPERTQGFVDRVLTARGWFARADFAALCEPAGE
jgi:soluble lytic murein transglycosylase-like protein